MVILCPKSKDFAIVFMLIVKKYYYRFKKYQCCSFIALYVFFSSLSF